MYEKIEKYFRLRLDLTQQSIEKIRKYVYFLGTIRLLIVVVTIILAYFLRKHGAFITGGIIFIGIFFFLMALQLCTSLQRHKRVLETSAECDKNELDALDYRFDAFDGAPELIQASHPFSLDLDIFGNNSLFQSINRTVTAEGKKCLARLFEEPENMLDAKSINYYQQAIKELSKKPDFLHRFQVMGQMNRGKDSSVKKMLEFFNQIICIDHYPWWRLLHFAFPLLWITIIVLCIIGIIAPFKLIIFYLFTLIVSELQVKKVNQMHSQIGETATILHSYTKLFRSIEKETFESELLLNLQSCFMKYEKPASTFIAELTKLAGELEQRSNLLVHFIFNPLLLWDIHKTMQIETWIVCWGGYVEEWICALGDFDACVSMANFAYTHPDYVYPELTNDYFTLKGKNLGHPLINRDICVRNDIDIDKQPYFMVITGANMSGKSTYLRTVGVNYLLACTGAPVCADSFLMSPAYLFTSLRTSDSLSNNESYFQAELERLKMIIDWLKAGEKLFIILDEILKGTNSTDKQKGSLALIQQLIRLHSCGIIATHDLLLGNLEAEFPDNVKNYHFDADIVGDKLTFSYQMQKGIAHNVNACFLMKKIGITL